MTGQVNGNFITELKPVYDKEFDTYYGQAFIEHKGNESILKSYGRKTVSISGTEVIVHMCSSKGQERHIREFLKQNNLEVGSLKTRERLLERYGA